MPPIVGSDHSIELVVTDPPPGNPEVHSIWMMLTQLLKHHPHLPQGKLAVIPDTELGKKKGLDRSERAVL